MGIKPACAALLQEWWARLRPVLSPPGPAARGAGWRWSGARLVRLLRAADGALRTGCFPAPGCASRRPSRSITGGGAAISLGLSGEPLHLGFDQFSQGLLVTIPIRRRIETSGPLRDERFGDRDPGSQRRAKSNAERHQERAGTLKRHRIYVQRRNGDAAARCGSTRARACRARIVTVRRRATAFCASISRRNGGGAGGDFRHQAVLHEEMALQSRLTTSSALGLTIAALIGRVPDPPPQRGRTTPFSF